GETEYLGVPRAAVGRGEEDVAVPLRSPRPLSLHLRLDLEEVINRAGPLVGPGPCENDLLGDGVVADLDLPGLRVSRDADDRTPVGILDRDLVGSDRHGLAVVLDCYVGLLEAPRCPSDRDGHVPISSGDVRGEPLARVCEEVAGPV